MAGACANGNSSPPGEATTSSGGARSGSGGGDDTGGNHAAADGGEDSSGGHSPAAGGQSNPAGGASADSSGGAGANIDDWELIWSDEFDGAGIDVDKWEHETNCWGGGNNEDQCYVGDPKNSFIADGVLHIVAIDDNPSGPEGGGSGSEQIVSKGHSSARLRTKNKGDFTYGRIEARLKLPFGQGVWPAFWMLPTDEVYGGWASSGEIDIMEAINLNPDDDVHGTLHFGGAWPDNTSKGTSFVPSSPPWEDFHVYAVQWEEGEVRWFVDDEHYATQNEWYTPEAPFPAPFNQRFHIVLNLAIGGNWPGPPDASTTFPQTLLVDYVRVYACSLDPETGHGCGMKDAEITPF